MISGTAFHAANKPVQSERFLSYGLNSSTVRLSIPPPEASMHNTTPVFSPVFCIDWVEWVFRRNIAPQDVIQSPVAVAHMRLADFLYPLLEKGRIGSARLIVISRTIKLQSQSRPADRHQIAATGVPSSPCLMTNAFLASGNFDGFMPQLLVQPRMSTAQNSSCKWSNFQVAEHSAR